MPKLARISCFMTTKKLYLKETLGFYWRFLKRYKVSLFLVISCAIITSVAGVTVPLYLKKFVDILADQSNVDNSLPVLYKIFWIIVFLRFVQFASRRIEMFADSYFCSKTMSDLGNFAFAYLHRHSFTFFNNNFVGSLVKRVNRFVRSFESLNDRIIFNVAEMVLEIAMVLGVLFNRNLYLGFALLVWIVLYVTISVFYNRFRIKYDIMRSEADSAVSGVLADTITNHVNVKLFNGYEKEKGYFKDTQAKFSKLQLFSWYIDSAFDGFQAFFAFLLEGVLMYIGIKLWQVGKFTAGDLMLIQAYVITVVQNIWNFGRVVRHIYSDLSESAEMTEILVTPHEIRDVPGAKDLKITDGKIEFKDVGFNYHETRSILKKFNLEIKSGQKVALVGPSGAGKSTLVKLLLRMHDVSSGKILIDGQNIAKTTQESLWKISHWYLKIPSCFIVLCVKIFVTDDLMLLMRKLKRRPNWLIVTSLFLDYQISMIPM